MRNQPGLSTCGDRNVFSVRALRLSWALACVWLSAGCATGVHRYSVTQEYVRSRDFFKEPTAPVASGVAGIRQARTVAFVPPDSCQDVKAAGASAREVDSVMRMRCGVIMSELERQAAEVGFEVVSWQQMGDGIVAAKASGVDLLFEVNELTIDSPPQDLHEAGTIAFYREQEPVVVAHPERVAARCAESFLGTLPPTVVATLDLKMVDVGSERVGWFYRDLLPMDEASAFQRQGEFAAAGTPEPLLEEIGGASFVVALLSGASAGAIGLLWLDDPDGVDAETAEIGWLSLGISATASSVAALTLGLARLFPTYPAPEEVLCVPAYALRPSVPAPAPSVTPYGSEVRLQTHRSVNRDTDEEARRLLIARSVQRFMTRLSSYRGDAAAGTER